MTKILISPEYISTNNTIKLTELLEDVSVKEIIGDKHNVELKGIERDSRLIEKDFAFLCIKGFTVDSHKFIDEVIEKGAKVIICEDLPENLNTDVVYVVVENTDSIEWKLANNFYRNPSNELNIFGITGTNGKTTTAKMVHELSMILGKSSGYAGTVGIEYNRKLEESQNTTGTPLVVQKMLRRMVNEGITDVAIEVSSHALVLSRLLGTEIKSAGFTNLTQDHLDFHKTFEEYEAAKSKLFSDYVNTKDKISVINIDDVVGKRFSNIGDSKKITYSLKEEHATLYAFEVLLDSLGTKFKLKYQDNIYSVETNLVGEFNVYNSLCAIGVMLSKGFSIDEVIYALSKFKTVNGRMELIENRLGKAVYVDYAHTPDGIENVLKSVNEFKKGRSIIVFGCGGDRDKTKRPIMGEIAERLADKVFVTNDNPRTENPNEIIKDILAGFKKPENVEVCLDREQAIIKAYENMEEEDVLIIAGKGHEDYQIIGKEKFYFSDSEVVRKI